MDIGQANLTLYYMEDVGGRQTDVCVALVTQVPRALADGEPCTSADCK